MVKQPAGSCGTLDSCGSPRPRVLGAAIPRGSSAGDRRAAVLPTRAPGSAVSNPWPGASAEAGADRREGAVWPRPAGRENGGRSAGRWRANVRPRWRPAPPGKTKQTTAVGVGVFLQAGWLRGRETTPKVRACRGNSRAPEALLACVAKATPEAARRVRGLQPVQGGGSCPESSCMTVIGKRGEYRCSL